MNVRETSCRSISTRVQHTIFLFEGFRLDAGRRQLSSSGGVVLSLNSRAMEALVILLSQAGDLVTKRQLLEGVWPGSVVEENNINQCILAIRKALGETAGSNRFIMTVPGRGYRFVAPVVVQTREEPEESQAAMASAVPSVAMPRWKILALPGMVSLLLAALGLVAITLEPERVDTPVVAAGTRELVVQLRHDVRSAGAPPASMLLDCLKQRPDLHLQVEVHVVGGGDSPVWTGRYIAGAEDVGPVGSRAPSGRDACEGLAAMR